MCLLRCKPWVPGANAAQEEATTPMDVRAAVHCVPCVRLEPTAMAAMNDPPAAAETKANLGNYAVLQRESYING